jgi:hypothetical protein
MLDDEYDKKIKEAAEHYHPAYDDTAWEKMSQLLDEHLPQKKERRKIFFILPSLLLVAALVFFVVMNNGKKDSSNIAQNVSSKNNTEKTLVEKPVLDSKEKKLPTSGESTKNSLLPKQVEIKNHHQSISVTIQKANKTATNSIDQNKKEASVLKSDIAVKENELKQQPVSNTNKNDEKNKAVSSTEQKSSASNNDSKPVISDENNSVPNKVAVEEKVATKNEKEKTTSAIKKSKKTNSSFADNFGVSISAGPDISGVHANKIGKLTAVFGAGLQYSISKHFSIRSGFYVSKKIYSVEGDDYNLPGGNPNYAYLENVSANCTVYEIPVKADYHFTRIKNHNWFISTGLSSYLMKKESYDYYYKTVSGEIYEKDWTINNKNKHFFSVLSFSGGYEYFFNKQFSFAAEPYINLPLKGIGVGKVKLNSGGILFTLKMKPFMKGK